MIANYFELTKPKMVASNVLVAAAAFIYASNGNIAWPQFFILLVGFVFVVSSACVFNNYFDRGIDAKMTRTMSRALPAGRIYPQHALIFGFVLFLCGTIVLLYGSLIALVAALVGFVVYVFLYTPLKHTSGHALYVGAVAGAMPPVVGYVAASNMLDVYALGLFAFLFLWQIPHFLAIAVFRFDEYAAADVPLLIHGPYTENQRRKARLIFYSSLIVLVLFCLYLILQR